MCMACIHDCTVHACDPESINESQSLRRIDPLPPRPRAPKTISLTVFMRRRNPPQPIAASPDFPADPIQFSGKDDLDSSQ
jgi:hypothetical protein